MVAGHTDIPWGMLARDPQRAGDRSDEWRDAYSRVRKDPFVEAAASNRRRLRALRAGELTDDEPWLDLGAGDGNLVPSLHALGVSRIVAIEPQLSLLARCPSPAAQVAAAAEALPLPDASVAVVVAMDVLHHLTQLQLDRCLAELRRVIRPGGRLLICEPAPTVVRRVLGAALATPVASLWSFSRDKRRMVELEADTLVPWLSAEHRFVQRAERAGFVCERRVRRPLHTLHRFRPA